MLQNGLQAVRGQQETAAAARAHSITFTEAQRIIQTVPSTLLSVMILTTVSGAAVPWLNKTARFLNWEPGPRRAENVSDFILKAQSAGNFNV